MQFFNSCLQIRRCSAYDTAELDAERHGTFVTRVQSRYLWSFNLASTIRVEYVPQLDLLEHHVRCTHSV